MKPIFLSLALLMSGYSAHAADCEIKIKKDARAMPERTQFSGSEADKKFGGYTFGILVDGANSFLMITTPDGTEISSYLPTPPKGTPPADLSIDLPNHGYVRFACKI